MGGARVRSSIGEEIATFRRSGLSEAWFGVNLDLSSPSRKAGRPASPAITKVELIKPETTNALGLTVPLSLLGRADEVIE